MQGCSCMHFTTWWPLPASRSSMCSRVMSALWHMVAAIGKPQACWTESTWFAVLVSHVQQLEVHKSKFLTDIYLPTCDSYSTYRCLELEIWRFLWWQKTDKTDCFTPCACAQGNRYVYFTCGAHSFSLRWCKQCFQISCKQIRLYNLSTCSQLNTKLENMFDACMNIHVTYW